MLERAHPRRAGRNAAARASRARARDRRRTTTKDLEMHTLMFQLKRAHLRAVEGARALSRKTGLTPARHDLLRCIESFGRPYVEDEYEELQSRIWRALGVSRTTVSKMVRRLIELGLAQRRRAPRDRRTFLVSLTREGKRRMRRAFLILIKRKPFQRRFERAFGERERTWSAHHAVCNLSFAVQRVARHFRDTSWAVYPLLKPFDALEPDNPYEIEEPEETVVTEETAETAETIAAVTPPARR